MEMKGVYMMKKWLSIILALVLCMAVLVGCKPASPSESQGTQESQPAQPLGTVRYAYQPNSSSFSAGYMIKALELNKRWNFDIDLVVTTGPNIYSALSAGELDIGYLGNGMAWHYFEPDSKIAIITLDNLTNDDRLLVRTGLGIGEDETLESLAEKLPGMTLACDLTTTPGTFLRGLVNAMNEGRADADKIWYEDVEGGYPLKGAPEKQILILNTTNANITAAMQDNSVNGCVTYGNPRQTLERETEAYVMAASPFTHLSNTITPSTWAVNRDFAERNPELFQAFVNALVEGMDYRHHEENWENCAKMGMEFDQLSYEDCISRADAAYWFGLDDLRDLYTSDDSDGYTYLEQIRNSHMGTNGLDADTAPQAKDVILVDFIRNAVENVSARTGTN